MINEKSDIVAQYNLLKKQLGHQPSSTEFYRNFKNAKRKLERVFGEESWGKLVLECGDEPKKFSKDKSNFEEILIQYGNLFRELKKHPSEAAWNFRCTPTVSGITQSHKLKWNEMPQIFINHVSGQKQWQDVIDLIPNNIFQTQVELNNYSEKLSLQIQNFIPPLIHDLIELSFNDTEFAAFEKKVNTAFEMLGFEVKPFGQGTGRKPDGIALSKTNPRYAILIDSKSRSDGYKFGTDDRAFVEYIKTYFNRLQNDGYDKLYFLVISSKFTSIPEASLKRLALETHVTISFLSSHLLLKILAVKIEKPRLFDLNIFRELLIENGEISEKSVNAFLAKLTKNNTI